MAAPSSLGKYEIRRQLGVGAMGVVYEAWDPLIDRAVAIKTVRLPDDPDPEMQEAIGRFRREAQAAGRLTHPNIVGVFDYGEADGVAYIVMELVDGPSLKSLLDANKTLPLATIVRIMEDILRGLAFSHDRGIVHRDIKPANVMITAKGEAKLADFGIARIENSNMTQAGTVLGTPAYMAPEQFMGLVVDARSDIYSTGVLLYQLLTGRRPFDGSMTVIMHKALHTEPLRPSEITPAAPSILDVVVKRAMAKLPADRFESAMEFLAAIHAALPDNIPRSEAISDATVVARRVPPPAAPAPMPEPRPAVPVSKPAPRRGKLPVLIGVATAAVFGCAGLGYFLMSDSTVTAPSSVPIAVSVQPAPETPREAPVPVPAPVPAAAPAPVSVQIPPQPPRPEAPVQPAMIPVPAPAPAPASIEPTPLERAKTLAATMSCAALHISPGPRVSGFAPPGPELERFIGVLQEAGQAVDEIVRIAPATCPLMITVAPLLRPTWDSAAPGLTIRPSQFDVQPGARVSFDITAKFPFFYFDIYSNDGTVRHVVRQSRLSGSMNPRVELVAGSVAGPAYVVGFSTAAPLDLGTRPETESTADYLAILRPRLATAVPRPFADMTRVTVRPMATPAGTAVSRPPVQPSGLKSNRCSNILARAQLGETLSDDELTALRTECRS